MGETATVEEETVPVEEVATPVEEVATPVEEPDTEVSGPVEEEVEEVAATGEEKSVAADDVPMEVTEQENVEEQIETEIEAEEEPIPIAEEAVPAENASTMKGPSTLTDELIEDLIVKNQNGDMTQKEFYHVFLLTAQRPGILERELKIMGDRLATTERRISQLSEEAPKKSEKQPEPAAEPVVEVAIEATEERIETIEDALDQLEEKSLLRVSSSPSRKKIKGEQLVSSPSQFPRKQK